MTKNISLKKIGFLFLILFPIFFALNFADISIYKIVMPLTVLLILFSLYLYRNVQIMMIIIIYIALYFVYLFPFFYFGIQLSQYTIYNNVHNFEKVALMFYIFFLGLIFSSDLNLNMKKMKVSEVLFVNYSFSKRIILFFCSIVLVILTFSQGTNIYRAANYYQAYKENLKLLGSSSLYGVIPLLILGFSYKSRKTRFLIIGPFVFLYCIFAITRGTRMVLVPYVMLIFVLCFDLKFKSIYIVWLCMFGFVFLLVLNMVKAKISFEASNLFGTGTEYLISHHTDMDYICCAILGLFDDNKISPLLRFSTRLGTLLEVIVPPKILPDSWKYPHAIAGILPNGGGCPMFVVLYISFFGFAGIFVMGVILSKLVSLLYKKGEKQISIKLIIVSILIFSSRWISYDFHTILRFPAFAVIFYYFIKITNFDLFFKLKLEYVEDK